MKPRHIIILSSKSSGSTALMQYFIANYSFQAVLFTRHHEKETLYWSKAAAILGLPQDKLYRSAVSFKKEIVRGQLKEFLKSNNTSGGNGLENKSECFKAYRELIDQFSPRFIEKSPHHLFNRSNLELLIEFMNEHKDEIDFIVIGLVRHPQDVIYSAWTRWKFDCREFEREWIRSYENLFWFREQYPAVHIVRYEDIARDNSLIQGMMKFEMDTSNYSINARSLFKWKVDSSFSHQLSDRTIQLARSYGYDEFQTHTTIFWSLWQYYYRVRWRLSALKRNFSK